MAARRSGYFTHIPRTEERRVYIGIGALVLIIILIILLT
jgi:hypothetical protein